MTWLRATMGAGSVLGGNVATPQTKSWRRLLLWLCVGGMGAGCSDYQIDKVKGYEPEPGVPEINVDPAEIMPGITCEDHVQDITFTNVGNDYLTVSSLFLSGDGWTVVSEPALPMVLDPDDSGFVTVRGQGGPASLAIGSDDPARSQVTVLLDSDPDELPTLALSDPPDGGALSAGARSVFDGLTTDGATDATTLSVQWTSDVDGDLGTATPDSDGAFSLAWDGLLQTPGPHTLTATLTDACGTTVEDSIQVCQESGYSADELDLVTWNFEGSAFWDEDAGVVELTDLDPFAVGTAFQTAVAVPGDQITIRFSFQTGGGTGADGFSLTALDVDRMTGFMGAPGCALGYGEAHESCIDEGEALPGWSIEVDTYYNPFIDPSSSDHLSMTFDGDLDTVAAWSDLPEVEDTGWHELEVVVAAPQVQVWLDGELLIDEELVELTPFDAYIGFTAATGADFNEHSIDSLVVSGDACDGWGAP